MILYYFTYRHPSSSQTVLIAIRPSSLLSRRVGISSVLLSTMPILRSLEWASSGCLNGHCNDLTMGILISAGREEGKLRPFRGKMQHASAISGQIERDLVPVFQLDILDVDNIFFLLGSLVVKGSGISFSVA